VSTGFVNKKGLSSLSGLVIFATRYQDGAYVV